MTKAKPTSLDALQKLQVQRRELDQREAQLRKDAAAEIGEIALQCGTELLDAVRLKILFKHVVRIGLDDALSLLGSAKPAPSRQG